jgi:predicted nucleotidyltransferase
MAAGCTQKISIFDPSPGVSPSATLKPSNTGGIQKPGKSPGPGGEVELVIKQDNKLTEQLKKEKEILDGRIYVLNGSLFGTMIIKNEIKQADIDNLVEKYGNEIRKAYKDCQINIQAVQGGKNVANKIF